MSRSEPIYIYPIACKAELWLKIKVGEEAQKRKLTESEYVRWVLEAWHKVSISQGSGNLVYEEDTEGRDK